MVTSSTIASQKSLGAKASKFSKKNFKHSAAASTASNTSVLPTTCASAAV